jgi:hypothetical protein
MDAEFERGRNVILQGMIYADVVLMEGFLDSLKENYAPSRTLIPFYVKAPGVDERVIFVKPLGVRYDWDATRRLGMAPVQFRMFAEDPRIYTSTLITLPVSLGGTVTTGLGFSFGFDFGFGAVSGSLNVNAANEGNRPTPATFIIYGPVTNPRILNDTTGTEMQFAITVESGETLVVDTKYRTVKLDGTSNRRNTLVAPTWFHLDPGDNFLRYLAESGGSTPMDVQYRHAWR